MYAHSYIHSAAAAIESYTGSEPLSAHLKKFFAQNKKYGSRDRKTISHFCYSYYRLGNALNNLPLKDRITKALFLCAAERNPLLQQLDEGLNEQAHLPVAEKMKVLRDEHLWKNMFPLYDHVSEKIGREAFALSHLEQPGLFLRVRPGHEEELKQIIEQYKLPAIFVTPNTIRMPIGVHAGDMFELNRQAVVQDYSSQQTGALFQAHLSEMPSDRQLQVLDTCAASGGKTILMYDVLAGRAAFTVNDIRTSMIHNLSKRLQEAGIDVVAKESADFTAPNIFHRQKKQFDVIITDVPCSGSGTWGRTPEHLSFFKEEMLAEFSALQRQIVKHAAQLLRPGGLLCYITCSVYAAENEMQTAFFQKEYGLRCLEERYFEGYGQKADTMYGAVLTVKA